MDVSEMVINSAGAGFDGFGFDVWRLVRGEVVVPEAVVWEVAVYGPGLLAVEIGERPFTLSHRGKVVGHERFGLWVVAGERPGSFLEAQMVVEGLKARILHGLFEVYGGFERCWWE